jgi:hypothetical protein
MPCAETSILVRCEQLPPWNDTEVSVRLEPLGEVIGRAPLNAETLIPLSEAVLAEGCRGALQLEVESASLGRIAEREIPQPALGEIVEVTLDCSASREPLPREAASQPVSARELAELAAARDLVPDARLRKLQRILVQQTSLDPPVVPKWVNGYIDDLNLAYELADRLFSERDLGVLPQLRAIFTTEPESVPSTAFRAMTGTAPGSGAQPSPFCIADAGKSFTIAQTGLVMDMLDEGEGELEAEREAWLDRSTEFVRRRAGPLNDMMCQVMEIDCGRISGRMWEHIAEVEDLQGDGGAPLKTPKNPHEIPESRHRDCCRDAPGPGSGIGRGPDDGGDGDDSPDGPSLGHCEGLWIHCRNHYREIGSQVSQATPTSKDIGAVSPAALCASNLPAEVTLKPRQGRSFGQQGNADSTLMYTSAGVTRPATIRDWAPDAIRAEMPADAHSGYFFFDRHVGGNAEMSEQCADLFGLATPVNPGIIGDILDRTWAENNVEQGFGALEVVRQPRVVHFFAGENGQQTVTAEACRDLRIEWEVDYGEDAYSEIDESSLNRIEVEIADETGTLFSGLGANGSKVLDHAESRTLTLTARARVGSTVCGSDQAQVTINRYQQLYLTPSDLTIDVDERESLTLRRSCATGSEAQVTLRDAKNRLKIDSPTTIPAGQDRIQLRVEVLGDECDLTKLKAAASGYLAAEARVELHAKPVIQGISPARFRTASQPDIDVGTSCPHQEPHQVKLFKGNLTESLTVKGLTGSLLHLEGKLLEPGKWDMQLISNGWKSERVTDALQVKHSPPEIDRFEIAQVGSPGAVVWCVDTQVKICWRVRFASEVVIKRVFTKQSLQRLTRNLRVSTETARIHNDSNQEPLKVMQGCITDTVDHPVAYVLEAKPFGDAAAYTSSPIVPRLSNTFKVLTRLDVDNRGNQESAHIWGRDVHHYSRSKKLGVVSAGRMETLTLPVCEHFSDIVSVLPSRVECYNKPFGGKDENNDGNDPCASVPCRNTTGQASLHVDDPEVVRIPCVRSNALGDAVVSHPNASQINRVLFIV